jgi:hypothetical protein
MSNNNFPSGQSKAPMSRQWFCAFETKRPGSNSACSTGRTMALFRPQTSVAT